MPASTAQEGGIRSLAKSEKDKLSENISEEIPVVSEISKGVARKMVSIEAFTPSVLNNQIVAMRKIVKVAHLHTVRKMNRQLKNLKMRLEKRTNEKIKKQIDKVEGDLVAMKTIKKDEVSKFALINKDSLDTLLNKPNTSPSERVLFKLATCPSVQSNVKAFRVSHPGSDVSCAFMLQRLGLQYQALRAEKVGNKLKKKLKSGEIFELSTEVSDVTKEEETQQTASNQLEKKKDKSVIEKVLTKSIEKAKREEKKTALTKKKKGEKIAEARISVKPIEIVKGTSKEAVVMKLNLKGDESDEIDDDDIDMESEDEMEEEDESGMDEEKGREEESDDEEETNNDGLSAFFLNSDGTSREVITSEMKDVEDVEDEGKRGGMRGMRMMRGGVRGRGSDGKGRMERGDREEGRGRGGNAQRVGTGGGGERGRGRGGGGERGRGRGGKIDGSVRSLPTQAASSSSSSMGEQLHPSWIAKQKQKEMMKAGPSGKKITFD